MSGITTVTIKDAEASANDTYMSSGAATTNYGTATTVKVGYSSGGGWYYSSWIKFDIAGNIPANANIFSATMSLWVTSDLGVGGVNGTCGVRTCLRDGVESEMTYNVYSTGNSWAAGGGNGEGDYGDLIGTSSFLTSDNNTLRTFTISTAAVEAWASGSLANYGMLLYMGDDGSDYSMHSSSSATPAYYPQLVVTYTTPTGVIWWG